MSKSTIYGLLAALCLYCNASGQEKPLHIGDQVPAIKFTKVLNHSSGLLQLPAAHGKAIILDFFATWCGGCVRELPRLAALQDSLQGQVQIWLVSREPKEKLLAFLQKRKAASTFSIIYGDSLLNKLFPNRFIPHDVWISPAGRVAAITAAEQIDFAKLQLLASGKPLALPVKKDLPEFSGSQPLSDDITGASLCWKSLLTRHIDGAGHLEGFQKTGEQQRLYFINQPLVKLYASAWLLPVSRLKLQLANPGCWQTAAQQPEAWSARCAYCYELTGPVLPVNRYRERMRQDLDMSLGVEACLDTLLQPVWTLVPAVTAPPAVNTPAGSMHHDPERRVTVFQQQALGSISQWLAAHNSSKLDGLLFNQQDPANTEHFTLEIPDEVTSNPRALQAILSAVGIRMECRPAKTAMLVIRDHLRDMPNP